MMQRTPLQDATGQAQNVHDVPNNQENKQDTAAGPRQGNAGPQQVRSNVSTWCLMEDQVQPLTCDHRAILQCNLLCSKCYQAVS